LGGSVRAGRRPVLITARSLLLSASQIWPGQDGWLHSDGPVPGCT